MQFIRPLVFLVCASYVLATKCVACSHEVDTVPLEGKCYRANAFGKAGTPQTSCTYEEKNDIVMGIACTYDYRGSIIRSSSFGACMETMPVDSDDCPPCLV